MSRSDYSDEYAFLKEMLTALDAIARFRAEIDAHYAGLAERVRRIRDRARQDEEVAAERAHAEIEPVRRQMEALILSLARAKDAGNWPPKPPDTK